MMNQGLKMALEETLLQMCLEDKEEHGRLIDLKSILVSLTSGEGSLDQKTLGLFQL